EAPQQLRDAHPPAHEWVEDADLHVGVRGDRFEGEVVAAGPMVVDHRGTRTPRSAAAIIRSSSTRPTVSRPHWKYIASLLDCASSAIATRAWIAPSPVLNRRKPDWPGCFAWDGAVSSPSVVWCVSTSALDGGRTTFLGSPHPIAARATRSHRS